MLFLLWHSIAWFVVLQLSASILPTHQFEKKLTPKGVSYGIDSTENVADTFRGGRIAPGSSINFLKNHWSSYCILGELPWPGSIALISLVPVESMGTPSNPFSLDTFTSAVQLLLRTICNVLSRFRSDNPSLNPIPSLVSFVWARR